MNGDSTNFGGGWGMNGDSTNFGGGMRVDNLNNIAFFVWVQQYQHMLQDSSGVVVIIYSSEDSEDISVTEVVSNSSKKQIL